MTPISLESLQKNISYLNHITKNNSKYELSDLPLLNRTYRICREQIKKLTSQPFLHLTRSTTKIINEIGVQLERIELNINSINFRTIQLLIPLRNIHDCEVIQILRALAIIEKIQSLLIKKGPITDSDFEEIGDLYIEYDTCELILQQNGLELPLISQIIDRWRLLVVKYAK